VRWRIGVAPSPVVWAPNGKGTSRLNLRERRRMAFGLMLIGVVCLLGSVATVMHRRAELERLQARSTSQTRSVAAAPVDRPTVARQWRYWLLAAGALTVVFLVASLAMARLRRRLIAYVTARPAPPTPADDVWQMHKVPEELLDQDDEQPTDTTPED